MPDTDSARPSRLVDVLVVFLVLLPFVHLPFFGSTNTGAKQFLLLFFTLGFAVVVLVRSRRLCLPPVAMYLGLFVLALFASALPARQPAVATAAVGSLAAALLLLLLTTHLASENASLLDRLVDGLLLAGTVAAALGLYQYMVYLCTGRGRAMLVPWVLPPAGNYSFRCTGIFGQPNLHALFLVLVLVAFSYRYGREDVAPLSWPNWLKYVPVLLVGTVFFLTKSRAGVLSIGGVLGFLGYLLWKGRADAFALRERREFLRLVLALLLAWAVAKVMSHSAFLSAFFADAPAPAQDAWGGFDRSGSNAGRLVYMLTALLIFVDHPWLGIGLDNFKFYLAEYQVKALGLLHFEYDDLGYTRWAHNEYLQLLCEGGLVTLLPLLLLLGLLLLRFRRDLLRPGASADRRLCYLYLFIFPFLLQSVFEWPLRFASMLALFLTFLGILLARCRVKMIEVKGLRRWVAMSLLSLSLLTLCIVVRQEMRIADLRERMADAAELDANVTRFSLLASHPYSEYFVLKSALPPLVGRAVKEKDPWLANRLIPFAERMTRLEGSCWSWYNLARLYDVTDREQEAVAATAHAIDLNPDYQPAWTLQHLLNMKKVAKATGVSLEQLLEQSKKDLEKISGGVQLP